METKQNQLEGIYLFSAPIYKIDKPEFLEVTKKVSNKFISKRKKEVELNPNYPVYMTEGLNYDPELLDFANYVAQAGWEILQSQGYAMNHFTTYFDSMWCQEHHQNSAMEKHIHGNGSVLSGFYFIECPKDSCKVVFHDPRDSKVITSLPEANPTDATHASNMIHFEPKDGLLMFSNVWLPHSFSKNASKKPMRFIHFTIGVELAPQNNSSCTKPLVEVI